MCLYYTKNNLSNLKTTCFGSWTNVIVFSQQKHVIQQVMTAVARGSVGIHWRSLLIISLSYLLALHVSNTNAAECANHTTKT